MSRRDLALLLTLCLGATVASAEPAETAKGGDEEEAKCRTPLSSKELTGIDMPRAIRKDQPFSTSQLVRWGPIEVDAVIDCKGKVAEIKVLSELSERAERSLRKKLQRWQFDPASRDGEPVAVQLRLEFKL